MLKLSEDIPGHFNISSMAAGTVSNTPLVPEVLNKFNYEEWSLRVQTYLLAEDLWDVVEAADEPPKPEDDHVKFKAWRKKNAKALLAIHISCGSDTFSLIRNITTANIAWDILAAKFKPSLLVSIPEYVSNTDNFSVYVPFFDAIRSGDWSTANEFLAVQPDALRVRTPYSGKTILHVAVDAGHEQIVEELVQLIDEWGLEIKANDGKTALASAADVGNIRMAQCMVNKNHRLVGIGVAYNMLPVVLASNKGHWELANYLYSVTPMEFLVEEQEGRNGATLVCQCVYERRFDIASDLLARVPKLAVTVNHFGESPLKAWASMPFAFPSGVRFSFWQRLIYNGIHIRDISINDAEFDDNYGIKRDFLSSGAKLFRRLVTNLLKLFGAQRIYEMKSIHVHTSNFLYQTAKVIRDLDAKQMEDGLVYEAIFHAVDQGNVEFIIAICRMNPELMLSTDEMERTLFHLAIKYRQEKIYSLIYGLSIRHALPNLVDKYNNNLLHMAAMLSPLKRLNHIQGAALQMQRELQWFKEVESIVPIKAYALKNYTDHMTPHELFTKNHKELMKEGEKWMKDTANSCTVLGALVITIVFAAAITVPGGINGNTGLPIFLNKHLFSLFMISDALSFFSSTTSLLIFWGIVTSRYAEDDFLRSLPTKMTFGLTTLLFSITAMIIIIAFCCALLIMLNGKSWVAIPIIVLVGIPVSLSVWMLIPLFLEMFISTFGAGIFDRKLKFGSKLLSS